MEISQLKNFLAVLEHRAISRAAHQLGIAQPALSQSIARMEKSLGVKLLERSRRGALPTAAALALADDVKSGRLRRDEAARQARKTVVYAKSELVWVDIGGRPIGKKKRDTI